MECEHGTRHQALAGDGGLVKRSVEVKRPLREIAERSGVQANPAANQVKRAGAGDRAEEKARCLWPRGLLTEEYPLVLCDAGRFEILPDAEV